MLPAPTRMNRSLAVLMLLTLLVANEWVLGYLFANDGSVLGTKLWIIRLFDVVVIAVAATLWFTRYTLGSLYRDGALVVFNVVLVFVVLNVIAYAFKPLNTEALFIGSFDKLWQDPEAMYAIYGTRDDDEIGAQVRSPGVSAHPSLQVIMRPVQSKYYNSGPEGSRVSCRGDQPFEPELNGAIWMFGGSTTYGTAVGDCATVASALNTLDPANTYINFGAESRNQNPEIDHLMLLLRKGYRPKAVIFMDGLNDIAINVLQIPGFNLHEVPTVTDQPYYFALVNNENRMFGNLLARLPLMQWLAGKELPQGVGEIDHCGHDDGGVYTAGSDFHENPDRHRQAQSAFRDRILNASRDAVKPEAYTSCAARLQRLYADDSDFLQRISRAYGFEYRVFFQPLTLLVPGNPFVHEDAFADSALKALIVHIRDAIRADIAAGRYPNFVDISLMGADCSGCMVDVNHYTRDFGREIAAAMIANLHETAP